VNEHPTQIETSTPTPSLGPGAAKLRWACLGVGAGALLGGMGLARAGTEGVQRFLFAYLVAYLFFLSLSVGALFFVPLQHITRAGWSVGIRRPAEILAANFPVLIVLALPLVFALPRVYRWADPSVAADLPHDKLLWLNQPFFVARLFFYLVVWTLLGRAFWKKSIRQDQDPDPVLTLQMQKLAPGALVLFALTVNFAAFDVLMSLDPLWYSTIFGVYFFSGCCLGFLGALVVILRLLPRLAPGYAAVSREHYHDVGKLVFTFVFFWGYIAYSQYMLIWYANLPEETGWFRRRGATTVAADMNLFTVLGVVLIVGHFAVPFLGLLSRHAKRSLNVLTFWCVLLLLMHVVDLFWLVRPELLAAGKPGHTPTLAVSAVDVLALIVCLLGVGGFYLAGAVALAAGRSLVPVGDPRLKESVVFAQPF
jgi:hypothetical protein